MENKFYYKKYRNNGSAEKLITVKNGELVVQPMWRAQLIAEQLFNVNICEYQDDYQPDSYDAYFERVAECMMHIGAYKMALKCRIKSLLLKYKNLTNQYDIPLDNLKIIYHELIDLGYQRAATRLINYHLGEVARVVNIEYREQFDIELRGSKTCKSGFYEKRDELKEINTKLKNYLDEYILPRYKEYGREYSYNYMRALTDNLLRYTNEIGEEDGVVFIKDYRVSHNMLYTAIMFHNLGVANGYDDHHISSAQMLREDAFVRAFFTTDDIEIMAEAIEDHRASSQREPRSFYGRILRNIHPQMGCHYQFLRSYYHSVAYNPLYKIEEHIDDAYNHLLKRYEENEEFKSSLSCIYNKHLEEEVMHLLQSRGKFKDTLAELLNNRIL